MPPRKLAQFIHLRKHCARVMSACRCERSSERPFLGREQPSHLPHLRFERGRCLALGEPRVVVNHHANSSARFCPDGTSIESIPVADLIARQGARGDRAPLCGEI
jgi:hypothetical protein